MQNLLHHACIFLFNISNPIFASSSENKDPLTRLQYVSGVRASVAKGWRRHRSHPDSICSRVQQLEAVSSN